jgi:hypothetical protein
LSKENIVFHKITQLFLNKMPRRSDKDTTAKTAKTANTSKAEEEEVVATYAINMIEIMIGCCTKASEKFNEHLEAVSEENNVELEKFDNNTLLKHLNISIPKKPRKTPVRKEVPEDERCEGKDGKCTMKRMKDSKFCIHHDPVKVKERKDKLAEKKNSGSGSDKKSKQGSGSGSSSSSSASASRHRKRRDEDSEDEDETKTETEETKTKNKEDDSDKEEDNETKSESESETETEPEKETVKAPPRRIRRIGQKINTKKNGKAEESDEE